jgi:hypothetical protein
MHWQYVSWCIFDKLARYSSSSVATDRAKEWLASAGTLLSLVARLQVITSDVYVGDERRRRSMYQCNMPLVYINGISHIKF